MIEDFLTYHNIPYPPHLDGWTEYDYMRILRFKGPIDSVTIPKILQFKEQIEKSGLQTKDVVFDGKKITHIDSAAVAALLMELHQGRQKVAVLNPPEDLKSYLDIFHQKDKIKIFESEEEAVREFNKKEVGSPYLPAMTKTIMTHKCLLLLVALVLFIVALPFFETHATALLYLIFFAFVLLAGIYAVSYNMRHVAGGVLLATPTLVTAWSNMFIRDPQIMNAEMIFLTIFLVYTLSVILLHILAVKKVTVNELFGAMCVYIMIGMAFGVVYALLESLFPGSLTFPPEEGKPKITAFFYFSFVSMSSTGFSGFTAASSLARAIVIVQVIIGVMYVSALIGKLVSANTPDDDGLFDNMDQKSKIDFWSPDMTENFFRQKPILLVLSMAMLNYASSVLMTVLSWPFFMDCMGTSLATILGGLPLGIMAAILYNFAMAFTFWGPSAWAWVFCSVLISFLTWVFYKQGWIDLHKPLHLVGAGVIAGVLNSGAVMLTTHLANLPIYHGTMAVYRFFVTSTGNSVLASVAEKVAVEIADKTISFILVAVAVIFIKDILNWNQKSLSAQRKK